MPVHRVVVLVRFVELEESVVDHKVVHLPYLSLESVVLSQERQQLLRGTVDGQLVGSLEVFGGQHVLKQLLAQAEALATLVHIKVQHAGCVDGVSLALVVEHVQQLLSHLQQAGH